MASGILIRTQLSSNGKVSGAYDLSDKGILSPIMASFIVQNDVNWKHKINSWVSETVSIQSYQAVT